MSNPGGHTNLCSVCLGIVEKLTFTFAPPRIAVCYTSHVG